MAQSINFDDGFKDYEINGDPKRIIRVDTADYGLIERFSGAQKRLEEKLKKYDGLKINPDGSADIGDDEAVEALADLGRIVREETNYIFNADIADIAFGGASPLSTKNGVPLYERFFNAVIPIIKNDLEAEAKASEKRINRYTAQSKKFKGAKK